MSRRLGASACRYLVSTRESPQDRVAHGPAGSWRAWPLVPQIEAQLDEPKPVVVVVPEELMQQRVEDTDPGRLENSITVEIDLEDHRRQLGGHVLSLRLPLVAEQDDVLAGAHDLVIGRVGHAIGPRVDAAGGAEALGAGG